MKIINLLIRFRGFIMKIDPIVYIILGSLFALVSSFLGLWLYQEWSLGKSIFASIIVFVLIFVCSCSVMEVKESKNRYDY